MRFKAFSQVLCGRKQRSSIGAAFFVGVITCYIILHCGYIATRT